ncbi:MAG: mechanosensitive ion channel family protein [Thermoanaerobaculia bacterium]|nr:mechanosensitive ion channel family protein [Thermoanaerobaculia bacterium]
MLDLSQLDALLGTNPWIRLAAILGLSLVAGLIVDIVLNRLLARWARRSQTDLDDQLFALLHRPIFGSVLLLGIGLAGRELHLPPDRQTLLRNLLATLALLLWVAFAVRFVRLLLAAASRVQHRIGFLEARTLPLFDNVGRIVVLGLGTYVLFLIWGIELTAWLASAGIIGIAIGFAAKDTLANLFGGLFILADAPYKLGDFVVLDSGERGEVTHIGLRTTRLLTRDDVEVTIPNAIIANSKIVNESGGRWEKYRVRVAVGVAYGSDIDLVRQVLLDVATACEFLTDDPEPRVRFRAFGTSSLDFEVLGWVEQPVLRGRVIDDLLTRIYKQFLAEAIEIPFPKRDLYIKEMPGRGPEGPPDSQKLSNS